VSQIELDTAALSLPHGRRVGQPGHEVVLRYLLRRMSELKLEPFKGQSFELKFTSGGSRGVEFTNLAGVCPGRKQGLPPLLVGAHYDSVIDAPCSDDNATAVAVVLSIAERFRKAPLDRDLVIAIFDSEEPPYFLTPLMGSIRFYEDHCRSLDFSLCVFMDLIGHDIEIPDPRLAAAIPFASELVAVTGCESHPDLPRIFEDSTKQIEGLRVVPTLNEYVGDMSDHHAFRLGGQPYMFLSCGEGKYYHTEQDDLEWINFEKVGRVEQLVSALLATADQMPPAVPRRINPADADTTLFEIAQLERAFGGSLAPLLKYMGLGERLTDRRGLTSFNRILSGLVRSD
jgi:hypothetical protein